MKKLLALITVIGLAITGCSTSSTEADIIEDPDTTGCIEARKVAAEIWTALMTSSSTGLEDARERFDSIALTAAGEIRDRLDKVVESIPEDSAAWAANGSTEYITAIGDLERACKALGSPVQDFMIP